MELLKHSFICPNCNREYYTYITRNKYQEFIMRNKSPKEIFQNYDISYSTIFTIGYCNECQETVLDIIPKKTYCMEVIANEKDDAYLYNTIYELEERQ